MTSQPITELVLQTEAILRLAVARDGKPIKSTDVVEATGLDAGSARRELRRLADAGLLSIDGPGARGVVHYIQTGYAQDAVAALDRAAGQGGPLAADAPITGAPTWPLDQIQFNPDNPRKTVSAEFIDGLADTIVEAGGLLQAIILYPADANGARMLHAGEQRVRACRQLVEEGRLPASLAEGLPFTERAASRAEALFIGLVENGQRTDLSPWEDAQALKAYADETGLSARAIAFKLGRAREGAETGVRDVQEKIRIATKAEPGAIAAYQAGGRWEDLRDSIREARALSPHAALAIAELRAKVEEVGHHPDDGVTDCWVLTDGQGARWASHRELVEAKLIEDRPTLLYGVLSPLTRITEAGEAWLKKACPAAANGLASGHDLETLAYLREGWGRMEGGVVNFDFDECFTTPWLNARHLKAQLERRRQGLPERDPDQVDLEEAIAAKNPAAKADAPLTPQQDLALVELKARIERKQVVAYGRARLFYPTPAWVKALHFEFFSPMGDNTHQPHRDYLGLTSRADAYLREKGLWVDGQNIDDLIRLARGKRGAWIPRGLSLGEFATEWLDFRGMNSQPAEADSPKSAQKPPAILDTPKPKVVALSDKQALLLAELADFLQRWPGEDILPHGPHGGALGLDTLGCIKFEGLVGLAAPKRLRILAAGEASLRNIGMGQLLTLGFDPVSQTARRNYLNSARLAVISEAKADALVNGEYVTPWLNTDKVKTATRALRDRQERDARSADHREAAALAALRLTERLSGIQELSIIRREEAGEAPLHTCPMAELAEKAVFELMHAAPFVAIHFLAAMHLKSKEERLAHGVLENAFRTAMEAWFDRSGEAGSAAKPDDQMLFALQVGDLVSQGAATEYRLLSRKALSDAQDVAFIVQPVLKGKDYGPTRALHLSVITRLGGANTKPPTSAAQALTTDQPPPSTDPITTSADLGEPLAASLGDSQPNDDPDRDAVSEDEFRAWIAERLIADHQVDPANAAGFAAQAYAATGLGNRFGETTGGWGRTMAGFDAADWAGDHLVAGQLRDPTPSAATEEQADAAVA